MTDFVRPEILSGIWAALNRPERGSTPSDAMLDEIAQSAWVSSHRLEDLLHAMDRRIDDSQLEFEELTRLAGVPVRILTQRPRNRFDEYWGSGAISAFDTATVLIMLERLGFTVNAELLCSRLRPALVGRDYVTFDEVNLLFHEKAQHRMPPLELRSDPAGWKVFELTSKSIKTGAGYRAVLHSGEGEAPAFLVVHAPRYRRRPDAESVTCQECGMTYLKGSPSEDSAHRRQHRELDKVLNPRPDRRLYKEMLRGADGAPWVDWLSKPWKRQLVLDRARFFRREFKYDFVQWELEGWADESAVGYLFADDEGRVLGACCFRPLDERSDTWRLDWIWLAPIARRKGLLAQRWPLFRERFGDFRIVAPISDAMAAFLKATDPAAELC